jgi:hypothetical protein
MDHAVRIRPGLVTGIRLTEAETPDKSLGVQGR